MWAWIYLLLDTLSYLRLALHWKTFKHRTLGTAFLKLHFQQLVGRIQRRIWEFCERTLGKWLIGFIKLITPEIAFSWSIKKRGLSFGFIIQKDLCMQNSIWYHITLQIKMSSLSSVIYGAVPSIWISVNSFQSR